MNQEFWENTEFSRYLQDIDPEDVRKLSSFSYDLNQSI